MRHLLMAAALLCGVERAFGAELLDAKQREATIAYVQSLAVETGGYRADAKATEPTLSATTGAARILKYLGGPAPDREACGKFVAQCFDPETGGFSQTPGGKPDPRTTAGGLMSVVELKQPIERYLPALDYLRKNIGPDGAFEDVRLAAAGLEAVESTGQKLEVPPEWLPIIMKTANVEGSFGSGPGQPRDTGGAVAAVLRLGGKLPDKAQALAVMRKGQRPDGGWSEGEGASDLGSTYRVMRSFHMLGERPDVEACRAFVAKCRNEDGGYGVKPGAPSGMGPTYFAAIILHWADQAQKREK